MRLLHISDLHAGKTLGRVSRNPDLKYALDQVEAICKEEKIHLLLIAGDIFDKANPDHESQDIILDFITRMHEHNVHIIMIAGNHDSYDFIKNYKHLGRLTNLHVFDRPSQHLDKNVFEFENLKIACLPYPSERILTRTSEESHRSYAEKVQDYIRALAQRVESAQYSILLAHLMVESALIAGTERASSVSSMYAVRPDALPATFHYVALGHVHRHQRIDRCPTKAYYSGSLYQLDFSERGMDKFVNLITLDKGFVDVKPIKLSLLNELSQYDIKDKLDYEKFLSIADSIKGYVKLVLYVDPSDLSFNLKKQKLQEILGDRLLRLEVIPKDEPQADEKDYTHVEKDMLNMYMDYYRKTYGGEPSEDLRKEIEDVLREIEDETHQART